MSTEEDCILRVKSILVSDAAVKIDFYVGPIHVDFPGFASVLVRIGAKELGNPGIGFEFGNVPPGAAAAYDNDDDVFRFPDTNYGGTPAQRAVIIHESVHAMRDIWGATIDTPSGPMETTDTMDEAAAYIAESLFRLYEKTPGKGEWLTDGLRVKADAIAKSIMDRKGAVVSDHDVDTMQDLVASNRVYRNMGVTRKTPSLANGMKPRPTYFFWSRLHD
jgi:hypothetical protein